MSNTMVLYVHYNLSLPLSVKQQRERTNLYRMVNFLSLFNR